MRKITAVANNSEGSAQPGCPDPCVRNRPVRRYGQARRSNRCTSSFSAFVNVCREFQNLRHPSRSGNALPERHLLGVWLEIKAQVWVIQPCSSKLRLNALLGLTAQYAPAPTKGDLILAKKFVSSPRITQRFPATPCYGTDRNHRDEPSRQLTLVRSN